MSNPTHLKTCPKCQAPVPTDAPEGLCPRCVLAGAAIATEAGQRATATGEIPSLQRVSEAFPQLEVIELVGRGGMGFVFKARQPHLDRFVALKLLPDKLARDARFAERFNREGRVLARLNHPNIVSVFDFGQAGGFYFLLMEFVDGVNLRQAMRAARFSPSEALSIVPKICEALQFAHEQGVLHRDIKPENILLDAKGRVKIADFGIAKLVEEDAAAAALTGTGAALGTLHYMAPEQFETPSEVDHRVDIYSLGVVFYEMLTGQLPMGRFGPPSSRTPLDHRVDEIVMRALERERELRQKDATQLKLEVERVTSHPLAIPPSTAGSKSARSAAGRTGPHGTVEMESNPDVPLSKKAVTSAVLVGASFALICPLILGALRPNSLHDAGGVALLCGIATLAISGTILGWLALGQLRRYSTSFRGRAAATFAALSWPLLFLGWTTLFISYMLIEARGGPNFLHRFLALFLVTGGLLFGVWSVFAVSRWVRIQERRSRPTTLGWLGIGAAAAIVVSLFVSAVTGAHRQVVYEETAHGEGVVDSAANVAESETDPWIRFTITAVELRQENEGRWLAIDYAADVHGNCERTFRFLGPEGFVGKTRTSEFVVPDIDQPVHHQRFESRVPEALPNEEALLFRDRISEELVRKSFVLHVDEERQLFELPVEGGTFRTWIGVKQSPPPSGP